MHYLPPTGSIARESFDMADLVSIGTGQRAALLLRQAKTAAKVEFQRLGKETGVVGLTYIALGGNDDLLLVRIGRRGAVTVLWNFTRGGTRHDPEAPVHHGGVAA